MTLSSMQEPLLNDDALLSPEANNDNKGTVRQHQQQRQQDEPKEVVNSSSNDNHHHPVTPAAAATASSRRESGRILDRDAAFFQSRGRWRVHYVSRDAALSRTRAPTTTPGNNNNNDNNNAESSSSSSRRRSFCCCYFEWKHFWDNWFYNLAYQRTIVLMSILFFTYTSIVFFFAFAYLSTSRLGRSYHVDPSDGSTEVLPFCDMDITNHMEALYFSLSTMTTIGYGVSDYYFGGCWTPFLMVLAQVMCAITFDSVAVGILFQRISRGHKRGKTILFSNKAAIQRVNGVPYLFFRVAELRRQHLLEATIRAYCIRSERHCIRNAGQDRIQTTHFVTKPIKLQHEKVGSHILMSLPQVLVHRIDEKSPLLPQSPIWYDENGQSHETFQMRRSASRSSNFPTDNSNNIDNSESSSDRIQDVTHEQYEEETEAAKLFFRDRETEIVVLLEGTDELTGAVIQARHSYVSDDFAWNQNFIPCVSPYREEDVSNGQSNNHNTTGLFQRFLCCFRPQRTRGSSRISRRNPPVCVIDFARFHETELAPMNVESCPYVDQ